MHSKNEYVVAINKAIEHTNDISTLNLVYKILIKSEARANNEQ